MINRLTGKGELRAVEQYRSRLSEQRGYEVSLDEAVEEWLAAEADQWRRHRHLQMLALQREEMLKHKWIESQKARCDVGRQAVFDWIEHHAAAWRDWFEESHEEV